MVAAGRSFEDFAHRSRWPSTRFCAKRRAILDEHRRRSRRRPESASDLENQGQQQRCDISSAPNFVTALGMPPAEETIVSAEYGVGAKRMSPFPFHVAPRPAGASQMACTGPPSAATFFSLPSAKKPINLPFGDQNG